MAPLRLLSRTPSQRGSADPATTSLVSHGGREGRGSQTTTLRRCCFAVNLHPWRLHGPQPFPDR